MGEAGDAVPREKSHLQVTLFSNSDIHRLNVRRMVTITAFCAVRKRQERYITYQKLCQIRLCRLRFHFRTFFTTFVRNIQQKILSSITIITCAATSYKNNGINKNTLLAKKGKVSQINKSKHYLHKRLPHPSEN